MYRIWQRGTPGWLGRGCLSATEVVTGGGHGLAAKAPGMVLRPGLCSVSIRFSPPLKSLELNKYKVLLFSFNTDFSE